MDKLHRLAKQHWRWLVLGGLLLLLLAAMFWIGYSVVKPAAGELKIQSVNLAGNQPTQVLEPNAALEQPLEFDGPIQGVLLTVVNFNQVVTGSLQAELVDSSGTVLASGAMPLQNFLNETPAVILTQPAITADSRQGLRLRLTAQYEQQSSGIALLKDESASGSLLENGTSQPGRLVYSFVTEQSGPFILVYYLVACLLLLVAFVLVYLLCAWKKAKLHLVFVAAAVGFGLCYSLALPPHIAPDEEVHIATAYSFTSPLLGQPVRDEEGRLLVRESDLAYDVDASTLSVFTYKEVYNGLFRQAESTAPTPSDRRTADVFPLTYLPMAAGIFLARLLGFNYITLVYAGRLFNLLAYTAVFAFAIKITPPSAKKIFFAIGLLPMALHLASSCSYDAYVVAVAAFYVAYCLQLYHSPGKRFTRKDWVVLAVTAALLAPAKAIYVFLCGFCLILPLAKFSDKKQRARAMAIILAAGCLSFFVFTFSTMRGMVAGPSDASQITEADEQAPVAKTIIVTDENGEQHEEQVVDYVPKVFFSPGYVLKNIPKTMKLTLRTVEQNSLYYLRQMVGGHLGEPILRSIEINGIFIALLYFLLFLSSLNTQRQSRILPLKQKALGGLLCLLALGALYVTVLSWTPAYNETIWGMQGRYLLPLLPLALLVLQTPWLELKKEIEHLLPPALGALHLLVVLNVFQQTLPPVA